MSQPGPQSVQPYGGRSIYGHPPAVTYSGGGGGEFVPVSSPPTAPAQVTLQAETMTQGSLYAAHGLATDLIGALCVSMAITGVSAGSAHLRDLITTLPAQELVTFLQWPIYAIAYGCIMHVAASRFAQYGYLFNPFQGLALYFVCPLGPMAAVMSTCAQFIGWLAGALIMAGPYASRQVGEGTPAVQAGFRATDVFVVELVAAFVLGIVSFIHCDRTLHAELVGYATTAMALMAYPASGAALNPYRYLSAAIAGSISSQPFHNSWWAYIVGNFVGMLLAYCVYYAAYHPYIVKAYTRVHAAWVASQKQQ